MKQSQCIRAAPFEMLACFLKSMGVALDWGEVDRGSGSARRKTSV